MGLALDNWLITKPISINTNLDLDIDASIMAVVGNTQFSILVSTTGYEKEDFTELETYTQSSSIPSNHITLSLNDYQGQVVRIAFRHVSPAASLTGVLIDEINIIPHVAISTPYDEESYQVTTQGLEISVNGVRTSGVKIYDITGRLIVDSPEANNTWTMPAHGVYILRVGDGPARKVVL